MTVLRDCDRAIILLRVRVWISFCCMHLTRLCFGPNFQNRHFFVKCEMLILYLVKFERTKLPHPYNRVVRTMLCGYAYIKFLETHRNESSRLNLRLIKLLPMNRPEKQWFNFFFGFILFTCMLSPSAVKVKFLKKHQFQFSGVSSDDHKLHCSHMISVL